MTDLQFAIITTVLAAIFWGQPVLRPNPNAFNVVDVVFGNACILFVFYVWIRVIYEVIA